MFIGLTIMYNFVFYIFQNGLSLICLSWKPMLNFVIEGQLSFDRLSLQATRYTPNPREKVISIPGEVLAPFSKDNMIPCFGFGDGTSNT